MKRILAVVLTVLSASIAWAGEQPAETGVKLEIRAAELEPAEGLIEMQVEGSEQKVYVAAEALLTEKNIRSARVTMDSNWRPQIEVAFDDAGKKILAEVTEKSIGKPLAILLDGKLISAPIVRSPIPGGRALISGNFTDEEAKRLAKQLGKKLFAVPNKKYKRMNRQDAKSAKSR